MPGSFGWRIFWFRLLRGVHLSSSNVTLATRSASDTSAFKLNFLFSVTGFRWRRRSRFHWSVRGANSMALVFSGEKHAQLTHPFGALHLDFGSHSFLRANSNMDVDGPLFVIWLRPHDVILPGSLVLLVSWRFGEEIPSAAFFVEVRDVLPFLFSEEIFKVFTTP